MLPDKINELLLSADFEFNQLAAIWISQNVPSSEWEKILEQYSHNYSGEIFSDPSINHSPVIGVIKRWKWEVKEGVIILTKIPSLWSQLDSNYKSTYRHTNFKLNRLAEAIRNYEKESKRENRQGEI